MSEQNPSSKEFEGIAIWEKNFWLSQAYLEASACLLNSMLAEDFSPHYSSSRVIIHLARQGVELFLKGSILACTDSRSLPGHDLSKLLAAYRDKFPGQDFAFDAPSQLALCETEDLFRQEIRDFHRTLDQRHRYPSDLAGREFDEPEEFDPREFLASIERLNKRLKVIEYCYIRPAFRVPSADKRERGKPRHRSRDDGDI